MNKSKVLPGSVIFPKGEKAAPANFIGTAWAEVLVADDSTFHCPVFNVTFEPGARNNWHKHPGGQILLVTGGKGYYQEEGKKAQVLREGDIIKIPPHVKHWHGAAADSWLAHIAIIPNANKGAPEWLEPVTDEEYNNL
jgi:quercetin dioxygenase-like cupin family protein